MTDASQLPPPLSKPSAPENPTFLWGMAPIPISDTPANFLVTGGIGSGKTITLRLLMQSALNLVCMGLDHRALVYDGMGTLAPILRAMGLRCPLHVLNPLDREGAAWDIAADVNSQLGARQLAAMLVPEDASAQPVLDIAARELLAAVCLSFIKTSPGKWTLRDLLLAVRTRKRLQSLLARAPGIALAALSGIENERIGADVLTLLATKLATLQVIAACWQNASAKFSLERWLREESVILLGDDADLHRSVALINQVSFNHVAQLILGQRESAARRTWIFLDEIAMAGRLEALPALMQRGHSKGVCVALALQRLEDIREVYGAATSDTLTALCSHQTALKTGDFQTCYWAERHFGPPVRPAALMALPPSGAKHGFAGFHRTPRTGTYFSEKPWDWVLANLRPPTQPQRTTETRLRTEPRLEDWSDQDYKRLGFGDPLPLVMRS